MLMVDILSVNLFLFSKGIFYVYPVIFSWLKCFFSFTFPTEKENTGLCSLHWLADKTKPSPEVTMETVKQSHILFRWPQSLVGFPKTLAALSSKGTAPKSNTRNTEGQTLERPRESNWWRKKKSFCFPCRSCVVDLYKRTCFSATLSAHSRTEISCVHFTESQNCVGTITWPRRHAVLAAI